MEIIFLKYNIKINYWFYNLTFNINYFIICNMKSRTGSFWIYFVTLFSCLITTIITISICYISDDNARSNDKITTQRTTAEYFNSNVICYNMFLIRDWN